MLHALRRRARRLIGRSTGTSSGSGRQRDAFAAIRRLDGPGLVPGHPVAIDVVEAFPRRLVVLIPSLEIHKLTGGPNTALNLGAEVAARGVPVRFVATHGGVGAEDDLATHVQSLLGADGGHLPVSFESVAGSRSLSIGRDDIVLATWWPTAFVAQDAVQATGAAEFLYLVQDYEPAFYPWSTSYALAQQTYAMPMRAIFNTSLLREHFVAGRIGRFAEAPAGAISIAFEPAIDGRLFRPLPHAGPRRLLFYARPGKARNLFELGIAALRRAVAEGAFEGDWEFWAIGEQVPELELGSGAVLRPMPWRSIAGYGELLGTSDVLLSLMLSPHPSYPPLEMAAAGGTVVTNTFGVKTAAALARLSPRIAAVPPTVASLAAALADAARRPRLGDAPAMALPATWHESLGAVVDWILAPPPGRA
jgi:O-antigen biosynthesis protein